MDIFFVLALATLVASAPQIALPVNSQVPSVAQASDAYQFTFSASTFSSSAGSLQYSLSHGPAWLQLNGDDRTFSGTPTADDAGASTADLTAKDDSGSTDMQVTFIVATSSGPSLNRPLEQQLSRLGPRSTSTGLLMYPSTDFNFTLASDTFTNNGSTIYYYAVSADNTPLPSWINFDGRDLRFYGTTPQWTSLLSPPQTFGIRLTASEIIGFAETSVEFQIVVDDHELAFNQTSSTIDVAAGDLVNVTGLKQQLSFDGQPVKDSDLQSVVAQGPTWIQLDNTSLDLSGVAPANSSISNVTILAESHHGNIATTVISIHIHGSLFSRNISDVNATIGQPFDYSINASFFAAPDLHVMSSIDPAVPWIVFDAAELRWKGDVPSDVSPMNLTVTVAANETGHSTASATETFAIHVVSGQSQATMTSSSTSLAAARTPDQSASGATPTDSGLVGPSPAISKGTIAAAIVIPIFILLVGLLALFCCLRSRRTRRRRGGAEAVAPTALDGAGAGGDDHQGGPNGGVDDGRSLRPDSHVLEPVMESEKEKEPPPTLPHIRSWSVIWSTSSSPRHSAILFGGGQADSDAAPPSSGPEISTPSLRHDRPLSRVPSRVPPGTPPTMSPPPIPNKSPARRLSRNRLSRLSHHFPSTTSTGIFSARPLSGAGHGAGEPSYFGRTSSRRSWRESERQTWTTIHSSDESARTQSSEMLQRFPMPRTSTIRMVPSSTPSLDPMRISASRRERYGNRSGPSPLFGGSVRTSSRGARRRQRGLDDSTASNALRIGHDGGSSAMSVDHFFQRLTTELGFDSHSSSLWHRDDGSSAILSPGFASRHGSDELSQLEREVSQATGQFASATDSVRSMDFASGGKFIETVDEDGNRRWYHEPATARTSHRSPTTTQGQSPDLGEDRGLEYATPVTLTRTQQAAPGPAGGPQISPDTGSVYSPRLVDFKPQRPVSVDAEGHRRLISRSASTAFI